MPGLADLIQIIPPDTAETPEDIFASAPGLLYPDDARVLHDGLIVYKSRRFGDVEVRTADPDKEEDRKLFSHYLWNAGIKMAELISGAGGSQWSVEGEKVLELGAGVGLGGIIATLAGAEGVVISDYPSPSMLENLRRNASGALPKHLSCRYSIVGHEWGDFSTAFATDKKRHFTRIIAADCYWAPGQHQNLARSMSHFLTPDSVGRVFVTAGFRTGRANLVFFFNAAAEEGLEIEEIYEEDTEGRRREWMEGKEGGVDDPIERKKWLVIARLKRRL